ncbi:MAG: ABC transporter ATP-binding protein [Kofleriaceae bacterium]|nr:ABC transporter ATP-binding protein [Kofleriaceae bacterium]
MSDVAIRAAGLAKRYRLGAKQARYRTFRETVRGLAGAPMRALRRLGSGAPAPEHVWSLRDVSFEIKAGDVVGVIGRNGAGKSTLLKILSRITEPTDGWAEIHGRVGSLLEVGTGFHPELSGRENIWLNGAILGMRRNEINARFDEIVAFAEVEKFVDTAVKHYSSGMYLRLAFAIAAHLEPEILLVDEVLAVGDLAFQKKCIGKMSEVAATGRTVLFVSHNMATITALTHRCLLLSGGRLVKDGPTLEVVRDYVAEAAATGGKLVWPEGERPGDESCRLIACRLGDQTGRSTFSSDDVISVELEFEVLKESHGLRVGFDLISSEGVLIFRSYHDDLVREPPPVSPGRYVSTGVIPRNLLNQGAYFLTLRAGVHAVRQVFRLEQALSFEIVNVVGSNSQYGGVRPGILNPSVEWSTVVES